MRLSLQSPDPRQAIRLYSYLLAVGTSSLVIVLLLIWHGLGMLRTGALCLVLATVIGFILAFYAIFRTGWNLLWSDPSLTLPQMAAASLTLLAAAYAADSGRSLFLVLMAMVSVFGALRLRTATLMRYALGCIVAYAVVIVLLQASKPHQIDLHQELLQLLVFALVMPWFALMGGYISEMREQLKHAFHKVTDSERALADAQRLAQFGSWSFDPSNGEAIWSEETYRIFGLDPGTPVKGGTDFRSLVHEADRERYNQLIDKALGEGQEFNTEYRVALPPGPCAGSIPWRSRSRIRKARVACCVAR
jgi:PAS domain-containing protein